MTPIQEARLLGLPPPFYVFGDGGVLLDWDSPCVYLVTSLTTVEGEVLAIAYAHGNGDLVSDKGTMRKLARRVAHIVREP